MNYAVISDIHGSRKALTKALDRIARFPIDSLIIAGDTAPRGDTRLAELLKESGYRIIAVSGNCDSPSDAQLLGFSLPPRQSASLGNRQILILHGHVSLNAASSGLTSGDILISGHTHIPHLTCSAEGILLLNPGSVTLPRSGYRPTFALITRETLEIREIGTTVCRKALELKDYPKNM